MTAEVVEDVETCYLEKGPNVTETLWQVSYLAECQQAQTNNYDGRVVRDGRTDTLQAHCLQTYNTPHLIQCYRIHTNTSSFNLPSPILATK